MADWLSAFEQSIRSLGYGEAPERRLSRAEVSALARQIAAQEGIKYTSARRRLERRRTTTGREARGQPNRRFAAAVRRRGLRVTARLQIDPSPGKKRDMRERTLDVALPGERLSAVADALDRSDIDAAAAAFYEAVLMAYEEEGDPDSSFLINAAIGEVFELGLQWLDTVSHDYSDLPF